MLSGALPPNPRSRPPRRRQTGIAPVGLFPPEVSGRPPRAAALKKQMLGGFAPEPPLPPSATPADRHRSGWACFFPRCRENARGAAPNPDIDPAGRFGCGRTPGCRPAERRGIDSWCSVDGPEGNRRDGRANRRARGRVGRRSLGGSYDPARASERPGRCAQAGSVGSRRGAVAPRRERIQRRPATRDSGSADHRRQFPRRQPRCRRGSRPPGCVGRRGSHAGSGGRQRPHPRVREERDRGRPERQPRLVLRLGAQRERHARSPSAVRPAVGTMVRRRDQRSSAQPDPHRGE